MEMAESISADVVKTAIKSGRNSHAFSPDKLSIFHLKNLGPRAIYNRPRQPLCHKLSDLGYMEVFINYPYT